MGRVDLDRVLQDLTVALGARPNVRRVLVFGSRARGDARSKSDIDLAIEAPGADYQEWDAISAIVDNAGTLLPIDLVRLDATDEGLRKRILAEGTVLFER